MENLKKLCLLLIILVIVSCSHSNTQPEPVYVPEYKKGDIVYLLPDSTIGVVDYYASYGYKIIFKLANGEYDYQYFDPIMIYGKKLD